MNKSIHFSKASDLDTLREIWKQVFRSDDGDLFFEHFFTPERCIIIENSGKTSAMGFLLPGGDFVTGNTSYPCGMIYALATLPEYRSKGFASEIVHKLIEEGYKSGYKAIILCPSDDALFDYYHQRTVFRENFYVCETKYNAFGTCEENFTITDASAHEYHDIRESLLADIPHIKMDISAIEYQRKLSNFTGGKLIKLDIDGHTSCAATEICEDGSVLIKELLTPTGYNDAALAALGMSFPSHEYIIRTPAKTDSDLKAHMRRFGMIAAADNMIETAASNIAPWYGFAFD